MMKLIQTQQSEIVRSPSEMSRTANYSPPYAADIPQLEFSEGRYVVRLAWDAGEIDAALRLRFEVFNLELGEGLESSYITGRDEDKFDAVCHHLIVAEKETGAIIGTYRLQTLEMAGSASNFYCANEFKLEELPAEVLKQSLEIGRACVAREHRSTKVLFLLWKGLAAYASASKKRYFFGCCSLTSQDESEGWQAMSRIERDDAFHPDFFVSPREPFVCAKENDSGENLDNADWLLPKLFQTYLRFDAKVCSPPAIDREFKTIDFFVMFDLETIDEKTQRLFLI